MNAEMEISKNQWRSPRGKGQEISKAIFVETPVLKKGPKFFKGFLS